MQCGRVEEFYDAGIEARQQKAAAERGFTIHDHSLYIYANCTKPKCPNKHEG
jgi:Fur family ferric uptake transcriptional regulator